MKKILIAGGNSGIGLEAAHLLKAQGHHVVLLGRNPQKGEKALAELANHPGRATFLAGDLSTHKGVRQTADALLGAYDRFDVLLHTTGVLIFDDRRTADGLHPFFAVNFLSRYHLTQRLLPLLRQSDSPRVIMLSADVALDTRIDFDEFPWYSPFDFQQARTPIQLSNHHYALHLREQVANLLAAVTNAGVADTDIWREVMPVREGALGRMNTVSESAAVPAALSVNDGWESGTYWGTVGKLESVQLNLARQDTDQIMAICHDLTGV